MNLFKKSKEDLHIFKYFLRFIHFVKCFLFQKGKEDYKQLYFFTNTW